MLSVLLAIVLAHGLGTANVSWAAFSGYMVMRGHVLDSLRRGLLRLAGTALGALGAVALGHIGNGPLMVAVDGGLVALVSLYGALTHRHAYAFLFLGLTFEMIGLDKLEHPGLDASAFAATRCLEVLAGTLACIVVSALSTVTVRRRWPGSRLPAATSLGWHPQAFRHAAQGAVAVALLPVLHAILPLPELAQAAVSIMAAMVVAVPRLGPSGLAPVTVRLAQRVAGCVGGALLAGAVLLVAPGNGPAMLAGTVVGVGLGRLIENGRGTLSYSGTQFTLAVLVTLVPDSYATADVGPGLDRLAGILCGIAILEPVLVAWHVLAPRLGRRRA
ncbi:FUSC family protein [Lichenihabitans sp. Uapishka_5]|uniref:FUSC family protein n=1 Tax=Lichenihabitans sp. Uapishka_5 TaxID=3037302 RepID=UPI0029E7FB6D|nr:FUSC family protein [Lichenihabitans sp. Uapishka_5]MDX7953918.1 FUSC family protein [Lichenihabitans sp. Uapishka_5]